MTSPDVGRLHNELHAVAAVKGEAFAVGEWYSGSADRTLIERFNGKTWSVSKSPDVGTKHNSLVGVAAVSTTHAWAVGSYFNGKSDRTLVLAWNGFTWKVQYSPSVGTLHNELDAVAASSPTNVWAVGSYFNGSADRTLIEHFDGTKWSIVHSPNVGTKHNVLDAITLVPGSRGLQAWAVGDYYNGVNDQTLAVHLKSGVWSVSTSPNVGTEANVLTGVVATYGGVFAVGSFTEGHLGSSVHTNQTLAVHFNGTKWSVMTTDNTGTFNNEFEAVFAKTSTSIYAIGRYYNGKSDRTLVQHWNGVTWHVSTSSDTGLLHNDLEGAVAVPGGISIAVGTWYSGSADRTLVESCRSCV